MDDLFNSNNFQFNNKFYKISIRYNNIDNLSTTSGSP
jgi:hypothetical protein